MKKVTKGRDPKGEELDPLKVSNEIKEVRFESLDELQKLESNTYYRFSENLKSIDALLNPDMLFQYFNYNTSTHGYNVKGLEEVHVVLQLLVYKLCSCIPINKYDKIGF